MKMKEENIMLNYIKLVEICIYLDTYRPKDLAVSFASSWLNAYKCKSIDYGDN